MNLRTQRTTHISVAHLNKVKKTFHTAAANMASTADNEAAWLALEDGDFIERLMIQGEERRLPVNVLELSRVLRKVEKETLQKLDATLSGINAASRVRKVARRSVKEVFGETLHSAIYPGSPQTPLAKGRRSQSQAATRNP